MFLAKPVSENTTKIVFNKFNQTMDEFNESIDVIYFVYSVNDLYNKVSYLLKKDEINIRQDEQHSSI